MPRCERRERRAPRRRQLPPVGLLIALTGLAAGARLSAAPSPPPREVRRAPDAEAPAAPGPEPRAQAALSGGCPLEMQRVGASCVDRWEIATVDVEGRPLSPYYPPDFRRLVQIRKVWEVELPRVGPARARAMPLPAIPPWQRAPFTAVAVSRPGVVPQGYMSYPMARDACARAGKRLCREDEWEQACRGARRTQFPYGDRYLAGACNVFRSFHPAAELHGDASSGHRDPRLNLLIERGVDPGLRDTGATSACVSRFPTGELYDLVGNLDEWVDDPSGRFRGGFYARNTRQGCDAKVTNHPPGYFDYSTGARCCQDAR